MTEPHAYLSLVDLLDQAFSRYASRTACVQFGHAISYEELDGLARSWASWLGSLGLPAGSRVAIMLPNVAASLVALVGTLRAGHVVVNINPLYTERELRAQLQDSQSQVIVVFEAFAHTLQKLPEALRPPHQVVVSAGDQLPRLKSTLVNFVARHVQRKVPSWKLTHSVRFADALRIGASLGASSGVLPGAERAHGDLAFIQYTGGTTGEPRGVMLTHGNLIANILQVHEVARPALGHVIHQPLTMLTALPLYHIFAMTVCGLYALYTGMRIVLVLNARDFDSLVKAWEDNPPAIFPGVNTLFNALSAHQGFRKLDFSGLRLTLGGGMAVQESVAKSWQALTGKPIIQGYGMSETAPVITAVPTDSQQFSATVGRPLIWTEIRILDDDRHPVASGEIGEVAVRGPQVMRGYWNAPQESAAVMTHDGFFLTGDLGYIDQEGLVTLVDRKKDMILVSGFNVFPAEVDAVFSEHPGVLECAAVGFPDEMCGEIVKLFVVPRTAHLDEESLRRWGQQQLTPYKRPREFIFVKSLPKNAVGKTLRRVLRDHGSSRL